MSAGAEPGAVPSQRSANRSTACWPSRARASSASTRSTAPTATWPRSPSWSRSASATAPRWSSTKRTPSARRAPTAPASSSPPASPSACTSAPSDCPRPWPAAAASSSPRAAISNTSATRRCRRSSAPRSCSTRWPASTPCSTSSRSEEWRRDKLHANHAYLKQGLDALGYNVSASKAQIIALEPGDIRQTTTLRDALEKRGVFGAIFFPPATPGEALHHPLHGELRTHPPRTRSHHRGVRRDPRRGRDGRVALDQAQARAAPEPRRSATKTRAVDVVARPRPHPQQLAAQPEAQS